MDHVTTFPGIEIPADMRYHELPAEDETLEFWGKLLASEDTDTGDSLRWAELQLYRIVDTNPEHDSRLPASDENRGMYGKQMWLLYTIGHSLVYHATGTSCRGGKQVPAGEFRTRAEDPFELVPCPDCSPDDWDAVGEDTLFRLEMPWYTYIPCQTPKKVVESLYRKPRCQNCRDEPHKGGSCRRCGCDSYREAPRVLSVPGRALLEKVAQVDPEIERAMAKVKRL